MQWRKQVIKMEKHSEEEGHLEKIDSMMLLQSNRHEGKHEGLGNMLSEECWPVEAECRASAPCSLVIARGAEQNNTKS